MPKCILNQIRNQLCHYCRYDKTTKKWVVDSSRQRMESFVTQVSLRNGSEWLTFGNYDGNQHESFIYDPKSGFLGAHRPKTNL